MSRPSAMSPKSKPADSDLANLSSKDKDSHHPDTDTMADIGEVPRTAAIPPTSAATPAPTELPSSHSKPLHQQQLSHMPYSSYPSHVFSQMNNSTTAAPLGMGQFPQLAHNFANVYPTPGTSVSANYSSFPRLNSISEDTAYQFGSRRNSILHNVDMQSNPSIDMSLFPSSFHHISSTSTNGNTGTGSGEFSIASSGNSNSNSNNSNNNHNNNISNSNTNNTKVVFNSIPSNNSSMPFLYGNTMYPNAPSQYGFFDPSVHDYSRDYSLSSNNNTMARNSSSNLAVGQSFSSFGMMQPFNPDKYLNSTATDHLNSTRRSSEQSDLYLGSKAQLPTKPMSAPSTNRSSVNSSSRNGTSSSIAPNAPNIPNGPTFSNHNNFQTSSPAHSMLPSSANSRQGSFFLRKFPSTIHLPEDLNPADLDSFLKRDSSGIQEIFDPLQAGALDQSNDAAVNGKLPEPQAKSRANSIFQLSFPSRASTSSLSHLFGPTLNQPSYPPSIAVPPVAVAPQPQPQPEHDTQPSPQDQSKTSQIPQHSGPQRQPQIPQGSKQSATAPLHNIKQPHQFMLQHQVYPHLFVQQQQQYQQLQMQQMQLSQQHLYSQHQPHQAPQLLQHQTSPHQVKPSTPLSTQARESLESKDDNMDLSSTSSRKRKRSKKSELNQENITNQESEEGPAKKKSPRKLNGDNSIQTKKPEHNQQIKVKNKRALDEYEEKKLINSNSSLKRDDGRPLVGATKVDQLMLIIQARQKGVCGNIEQSEDGNIDEENILPNPIELVGGVEKTSLKGDKSHQCKYCQKKFTQSTHLDVHLRSHMGVKPYKCEFCDKRFTQGGNLRTHMRLHTGEKPFKCNICDKQFSRKGNLQAHLLTHDNSKPFICKFDGCNKGFTQLGNLKAHQNRFHLDTINELFNKLAQLGEGIGSYESLPKSEKDLLDYFSSLYKNLNKGIKGRGKARKETLEPDQGQ